LHFEGKPRSDAAIPVSGVYESHLTVANLDRSIVFYRDVVGLELAPRVPSRNAAFFWIGGRERSMLGLWCMHTSPLRLRLHIAFATELEQVRKSVAVLRSEGIAPRSGGGPEVDEPAVFPWMPAASVYFDDPDGHSLEYIAVLPHPPRPDMPGRIPLSAWEAIHSSG
jgi:catechol 2,3-dioxygenase-like lactoylglutathione lyase family enzyme